MFKLNFICTTAKLRENYDQYQNMDKEILFKKAM